MRALTNVITYQLAYLSHRQVTLCPSCVERGDHDLGSLGPVQHGLHRGTCESPRHPITIAADPSESTWYAISNVTPDRGTVCDPSKSTLVWCGPAGHEIGDRIWHGGRVARMESAAETMQVVGDGTVRA